jgi:putative tryptophan/tyrosine transport system substrate-binding protein
MGTDPIFLICKARRALAFFFLLAFSFTAAAQSGRVYRIGLLETTSASANRANLEALLRGLRDAGYVEGKNLIIDYRSADGRSDRFAELAADLVRAKPDVIVTRGTPAALAAKNSGVPVVMAAIAEPVATKVVANLARPGGNVTGLTTIVNELQGKRIELIKQLLPSAKEVGYFGNPLNPNWPRQWQEVEQNARALGLEAKFYEAKNLETLNRALEAALAQQIGALIISVEAVLSANRRVIVDFAAQHKLPVMYSTREFVDMGGLISYGVHYPDLYYRAASYVDKILKGAKPGDLPIEQPTKLELVINLKTAKALGIAVPQRLLLRADEVIE